MHDFHPSDRDNYEEVDEIEDILESLEEQSEINQLLGEVALHQVIMIDSDSDDEFLPESHDENDGEEVIEADDNESTDESESLGSSDTDDHAMETQAENSGSTRSQNRPERRIIDDYDPNDEDDEVVRKIITELKKERSKPKDIITEDFPTDLSFHPEQNLLAVATVMGDVMIYRYTNEENELLHTHEIHRKGIRDIEFSSNGTEMISCSRDKSVVVSDFETGKFKRFWDNAHSEPIYTLTQIDENLIASGDDEGTVRLWDVRVNTDEPVFSVKEVEDYISQIITNSQKRILACTSGDGYLTTINIGQKKMLIQSEPYEEELTCGGIFRNESKLILGSSKGNFYTFNWGEFGYHNDAFSGPSTPISFMLPITERIAVTAGEEGVIRAMHLVPGR
jgi:WD40 repeat protein